ncbi:mRNA-capping enzyme [Trichoplax sp. H2]|nr:mRNA-capping enzyme [Trichoplax sp. H2]|eukprot:RDD38378.1 mRNA-capping enzyme [Trichoplax sp. H2]
MSTSDKFSLPIPPRWLKCPRRGNVVAGKFLPFKVPLDSRYNDQIPIEDRFDINMLFQFTNAYKINLGLIIDLTNTDRFYSKSEVESNNAGYLKLRLKGHGEVPSPDQCTLFIEICMKFIQNNPNSVIGIHCTHGFNRTGFLICCYLIEKEDWSVQAALREFASARSPGIYKGYYMKELAQRYDPNGDFDYISTPELPEWCNEDPHSDEEIVSSRKKRKRNEHLILDPKFMEGVRGPVPVRDQSLSDLQELCQEKCGWMEGGFPGSQPVSLTYNNITLLRDRRYRVSWKADGVRYMMLIHKNDEIYMIDRNNSIFKIPHLKFPRGSDLNSHIENTLLDGEMVIDKVSTPNGDQYYPRYLIYDIICFEDENVGNKKQSERMAIIEKEIISPRNQAAARGIIDKTKETFSVRNKQFFDAKDARYVLDTFTKKVFHETDGLIFSPEDEPYIPGRCDTVLKWKPAELNTVDFKLHLVKVEKHGCLPTKEARLHVGYGNSQRHVATIPGKGLNKFDSKIVECCLDGKTRTWKILRIREDKAFPNAHSTFIAVCNSILMPITKDTLYYVVEKRALPPELIEKLKKTQSKTMSRRDSGSYSSNEGHSTSNLQAQQARKFKSST